MEDCAFKWSIKRQRSSFAEDQTINKALPSAPWTHSSQLNPNNKHHSHHCPVMLLGQIIFLGLIATSSLASPVSLIPRAQVPASDAIYNADEIGEKHQLLPRSRPKLLPPRPGPAPGRPLPPLPGIGKKRRLLPRSPTPFPSNRPLPPSPGPPPNRPLPLPPRLGTGDSKKPESPDNNKPTDGPDNGDGKGKKGGKKGGK